MQNQPITPAERDVDNERLISGLYNQPNESQEANDANVFEHNTQGRTLYECNFCNAKYVKQFYLAEHKRRKHFVISFFCWLCRQNLKMTFKSMSAHFKIHENYALRETHYTSIHSNDIMNVYQRSFRDDEYWNWNTVSPHKS